MSILTCASGSSRCLFFSLVTLGFHSAASRTIPAVGDVLRVPDRVTGISDDEDKVRFVIVVAVLDINVRVLPRSTSIREGIELPMSAMDCFDAEGWVAHKVKSLPFYDLADYVNEGPLPDQWRDHVVDFYRACEERKADAARAKRGAARQARGRRRKGGHGRR